MHFAVNREHRDFFRTHHWIECEELLSSEELHKISRSIALVLGERLKVRQGIADVARLSPNQMFSAGRDVWRGEAALKKIVLSRGLAGIAAELTEQRPLRLGYDMLFPSCPTFADTDDNFEKLIKTTPTLSDISALQGVICGAMLCISAPSDANSSVSELFSLTPGSAIFFPPDWPLPLHDLTQRRGAMYLMVVYVQAKAVYLRQENDPHVHALKSLGYQFGDRLTDLLNPIVYP
ncbi:MAG: hypothetical protein WCF65_08570 [Parachlamydiaceae bacterium]